MIYSKNITKINELDFGIPIDEEYIKKNYSNPDNDSRGLWTTMDLSANHKGPYFPIINTKDGTVHFPAKGRYWVFSEKDVLTRIMDGRIIFGKTGITKPVQRVFLKDRIQKKIKVDSWWDKHGLNSDGTFELNELFEIPKIFDHSKPSKTILKILTLFTEGSDKILDFFAGSGTTAHALMKLNSEDGGKRQCLSVQLPEPTDEKSEANTNNYLTIADITKERLRRAGEKIKAEIKTDLFSDPDKKLDIGFKAFKLDSSNINAWDGNVADFERNLFNSSENIKEGRTEEDVLYEILLKNGLNLTLPITTQTIAGKTVYNIGEGALFICLANGITTAVAEGIGKWKENLQPVTCKVIFRDNGFTDVEKTNSIQILKRYGITEVNSI